LRDNGNDMGVELTYSHRKARRKGLASR